MNPDPQFTRTAMALALVAATSLGIMLAMPAGAETLAPGEAVQERVLDGAFLAPLPEGWETGSYNDDEVLIFRQKGLQGEINLFRHSADRETGWLDEWYIPDNVQPLPVKMLGQPALLYEWTHDPKSFADGSDDDAITRVYVFETCLHGSDTASISLTGLPSFHDAMAVQSLLDAIEFRPGEDAAPCGEANLPKGAMVGAPEKGRRSDSNFTLYVVPAEHQDWTAQTYAGHSFALPTGWTGGDNGQGAKVYLSSTGQYQIAFTHMPQRPAPRGERAEVRFADGTRFLKFKEVEGETLVSFAPTGPDGHLVIGVTGGQFSNETFLDILATIQLAAPAVSEPQSGSALNGLLSYTVPDGWYALEDTESLTLMAADGRGFLTAAKGKAVLPPYGLAAQVPPGRLGSFAQSHFKHWTQYGWPSAASEFMDGDQPAEGWYFLNILRGCLPAQEPVAIFWGGISRFLDGDALKELNRGLVFAWPEAMEECQLENAGVGQAEFAAPPTSPTSVRVPDPIVTAPVDATPPAPAPMPDDSEPVREAQALLPPPSPVERDRPDPDSYTVEERGYAQYQNARFGTVISYPANLFWALPEAENGDGRRFASVDGRTDITVYAGYNVLERTVPELLGDALGSGFQSISATKMEGNRFEVSGVRDGRTIIHAEILDAANVQHVVEISMDSSVDASTRQSLAEVAASLRVEAGAIGTEALPAPKAGDGAMELAFWKTISNSTDPADFEAYLAQWPNGTFAALARNRINRLGSGGGESPSTVTTPAPDNTMPTQEIAEPQALMDSGWWVIVGSFPTEPWERQNSDFERTQSTAARCGLAVFNDFSAKFSGFRSGYNVFVVGAFESQSVANKKLLQARKCFPDAYVKYGEYLGE